MQRQTFLILLTLATIMTSCNSFEDKFYDRIAEGQINAVKNGYDIFDLSTITDFEWDSLTIIKGNESVPVSNDEIERILVSVKASKKNIHQIEDLPINKDRFYFLTKQKTLVIREIYNDEDDQPFDIEYCLIDTLKERHWLSKKECNFLLKTTTRKFKGDVILFARCKTRLSPKNIKMWNH